MIQSNIKFLLTQIRKVSNQQDQSILECINLIKNVLDSKVQKNLDVLIQSGLPSILLEVIFKQGLIDDQQRFEAFIYYRELFESEYTFKEMKEETALETYKLIKILPGPIYDLFTDDGEEQLIFNQLNEIKSSPILVWSEEVRKEILLTYVTYTNSVIKQIEHRRVNQLALPQLANEVLVQDIILMNFNKQPTWYFEEGLISFMSELCDQIDQSIKKFYKATNQRFVNRLLTQFTSFMLALEQYFMNTNHPEFVEELSLLEEYDQDKLERIIEKQRDTISVSIVKYIYNWFKLFKENKDITLIQMRSLMIQILYLLFHSEVAIIIMDESDEFFIYFMIEYLLDIIKSKSTDGEKLLCLQTINKLMEHKFVYQKISNPNFMQLYELCLLCENKQMESIFKNIMAIIQNETNKSIEFSQFLLDSNINIKKKHHLDMIQSNQIIQLESIWRTNFDDTNFILIEEEKSQYPQIPRESIEQLPDMPFGLFHKLENIQQYYEDYVKLLRFGNIVEFQYQPDLKEVKEQTRESLVIRQTQVLLVDDDEIFS